mmetsp:Transcript_42543/g.106372  ORF Transcript_42543/g.106372 Transcript_42543/m.106372 type:complete len:220 (+) Transcript_42543:1235-1894(+)
MESTLTARASLSTMPLVPSSGVSLAQTGSIPSISSFTRAPTRFLLSLLASRSLSLVWTLMSRALRRSRSSTQTCSPSPLLWLRAVSTATPTSALTATGPTASSSVKSWTPTLWVLSSPCTSIRLRFRGSFGTSTRLIRRVCSWARSSPLSFWTSTRRSTLVRRSNLRTTFPRCCARCHELFKDGNAKAGGVAVCHLRGMVGGRKVAVETPKGRTVSRRW